MISFLMLLQKPMRAGAAQPRDTKAGSHRKKPCKKRTLSLQKVYEDGRCGLKERHFARGGEPRRCAEGKTAKTLSARLLSLAARGHTGHPNIVMTKKYDI